MDFLGFLQELFSLDFYIKHAGYKASIPKTVLYSQFLLDLLMGNLGQSFDLKFFR
jgi:hypothetical protein